MDKKINNKSNRNNYNLTLVNSKFQNLSLNNSNINNNNNKDIDQNKIPTLQEIFYQGLPYEGGKVIDKDNSNFETGELKFKKHTEGYIEETQYLLNKYYGPRAVSNFRVENKEPEFNSNL